MQQQQQVRVSVSPDVVHIENLGWCQQLNCEFRITNAGATALRLDAIRLSILDADGRTIWRRAVDRNAIVPSIQVVGETTLLPGADLLIINPFHTFAPDLPLNRLEFIVQLSEAEGTARHELTIAIESARYAPRTALILPLPGRLWISDGHDFYGHERRIDLAHPFVQHIGLRTLSSRYAYDLVGVDARGIAHRDAGERPEDWFGFGTSVGAPADGVVVTARDGIGDIPDHGADLVINVSTRDQLTSGNHVVLDHGNGEYSLLAHLQHGSVTVRPGERVRAGQVLGRLGNSGGSPFPHLHYQLCSGPSFFESEGLPVVFQQFRRWRGEQAIDIKRGVIEPGEIVESTAPATSLLQV